MLVDIFEDSNKESNTRATKQNTGRIIVSEMENRFSKISSLSVRSLTDVTRTQLLGTNESDFDSDNKLSTDIRLSGNYSTQGSKITIYGKITDPKTGTNLKTHTVSGEEANLTSLVGELVKGLLNGSEEAGFLGKPGFSISLESKADAIADSLFDKEIYEMYYSAIDIQNQEPSTAIAILDQLLKKESRFAPAYKAKGYILGNLLGQWEEGETLLLRANSLFQQLKWTNNLLYADLLTSLGSNAYSQRKSEQALSYYEKSAKLYRTHMLTETKAYANLMYGIGGVFLSQGNWSKATEYFQDSESILQKLGIQSGIEYANLMYGIGYIKFVQKDLSEAQKYLELSSESYKSLKMEKTLQYGNNLLNLALVYEKLKKEDMAGNFYRQAYEIYVKIGYEGKEKEIAKKNAIKLHK